MLRHYLELKAAHPERMVFYWLRGFFGCLLEDAITLSRVLELTPAARRSAKRYCDSGRRDRPRGVTNALRHVHS